MQQDTIIQEKKQQIDFQKTLQLQKKFFESRVTLDLEFRKAQLKKLKEVLKSGEDKLYDAIYQDLGKSEFETYTTEISFLYNEIDFFVKKMNSLAKPKRVSTNILNQLGSSRIYYEPFGNTLVIGAWNYPIQLSILPAIAAIAAGNTVMMKPSEVAGHTAATMQEIINSNFDEGLFHVFQGGVEETTEILKMKFDKIFFTGSPAVGKIIYKAAAEHLTPVTLELGGKSPVIVTSSANLKVAAKRIVWGKFLNAGQTCIAPDYIYVDEKVKDEFLKLVKEQIENAGYTPGGDSYTRIINERHFERLAKMLDSDKTYYGGKTDKEKLYIEPTVLHNMTWEDPAMQEEIFGPILPVLSYSNYNEMIAAINQHEKPLSAYLFTNSSSDKEKFTEFVPFGGGCINDTVMHFTNPYLPFGGVGNSGIGSYHGKYGFETFSHPKSVMDRATWGEPNLKYPPYTETKKKWMKKIQ